MTVDSSASSRKRQAILEGAANVFARDGYARASVDAIASEARVSTRTLYNHFGDKAGLFAAVLEHTASTVAARHVAAVRDTLGRIEHKDQLEAGIVEMELALEASGGPEEANHWALVRHVQADVDHIPATAINRWREKGPCRTMNEISRQLARLGGLGLLQVEDPGLAAVHLTALLNSTHPGALTCDDGLPEGLAGAERQRELVVRAVRAFLHGYQR